VVTAFYTAELTAVLTLTRPELPVSTLNDLHTLKDAKWVAVKGAQTRLILEVT